MRTWTSVKGDTVEAVCIRYAGKKVLLKTAEGKELNVPVKGLSKDDKDYLASLVPPTVIITVDVDIDRDTVAADSRGFEQKKETVNCEVLVKKTNRELCNRTFTVHVCMFAKQVDGRYYWLVSRNTETLEFTGGLERHRFTCPPAVSEFGERSYDERRGFKYEGYIVIIVDEEGELFAHETNRDIFKLNWRKIKNSETYTVFDRFFYLQPRKRKSSF